MARILRVSPTVVGTVTAYARRVAFSAAPGLALCILLTQSACQSMSTRGRHGADRDSLSATACREVARENRRLRAEMKSRDLDLAKLRAENERQSELNGLLTEEISQLKDDLGRVEKQFIKFEQRLQAKETKASAVAAIAEVQMLFDNMRTDDPGLLDSLTVTEVASRLTTSDEMVRTQNYAAAVYFANRAMRLLNQRERRRNLGLVDGDALIIAVSKANVRSGPGPDYDVVDKLEYGTVVVQLRTKGDWYRVRIPSGQYGWVHRSLVR